MKDGTAGRILGALCALVVVGGVVVWWHEVFRGGGR